MPLAQTVPHVQKWIHINNITARNHLQVNPKLKEASESSKRSRSNSEPPPAEADAEAPEIGHKEKKMKTNDGGSEGKKKKKWKWRVTEKEKKSIRQSYKRFKKSGETWVPPEGFTLNEWDMCRLYMCKWHFESMKVIPRWYKKLKRLIDQVRNTKGYGVTVTDIDDTHLSITFTPVIDLGKDPRLQAHLHLMIGEVKCEMKENLNVKPAGLQLKNAVWCSEKMVYLISHSFEVLKVSVSAGQEVEADSVESMHSVKRGGGIRCCPQLLEWKLKRGSQLVYSTESTEEGMEFFNKRRSKQGLGDMI